MRQGQPSSESNRVLPTQLVQVNQTVIPCGSETAEDCQAAGAGSRGAASWEHVLNKLKKYRACEQIKPQVPDDAPQLQRQRLMEMAVHRSNSPACRAVRYLVHTVAMCLCGSKNNLSINIAILPGAGLQGYSCGSSKAQNCCIAKYFKRSLQATRFGYRIFPPLLQKTIVTLNRAR